MEKAKAAAASILSKAGKHDTTVHENVAPAVQHETVTPQRHEEVQTVVDKEVHQDHYHTSVQPIKDREVLPEQHHHNLAGAEVRKHEHDDPSRTKEFLERERAKFTDTSTTAATRHTQAAAPSLAGEHVHHHVHENIQPVVEKETVQPHVVHTTVPVHEVHHNAAQHHSTSALPAMTMDEFRTKGGELSGRGERYDAFEGQPKAIGGLAGGGAAGTHGHGSHGTGAGLEGTAGTGHGAAGAGSGLTGDRATGTTGTTGHSTTGHSTTGSSGHGTTGKPSLMDKLNPKVDADGDGKKGLMD